MALVNLMLNLKKILIKWHIVDLRSRESSRDRNTSFSKKKC